MPRPISSPARRAGDRGPAVSPVAKRRGGSHTRRAVVVTVVGVALALGTAFLVATLTGRGDVAVRLGDDRFNAGSAERLLGDIQERGAPLGFNDLANFRRPIWVDNGGDDPDTGWVAIGAFLPDDPDCLVQWTAKQDRYVATCDESVTFPRSGAGLRVYPTEVVDGRLVIDLQDPVDSD